MWWSEFEIQIIFAFNALQKNENRQVYSERMKLRTLLEKIKADFLEATKTNIEGSMAAIPMTMTYELAMTAFCNAILKSSLLKWWLQK